MGRGRLLSMRVLISHAAAPAALFAILTLVGCGADPGVQPAGAPAESTTAATTPTPSPSRSPASATSTAGAPADVGELAFTGTTLGGEPFNAATLAGKPALLWFWAPWCSVCAAEAPDVLAVQQQHGGDVGIVGVAGLDHVNNMQPFVDRTNTGPLTHLADPTGEIWRKFAVTQQSTYVLLDAAGKVTFSGVLSGDDLRDKIAALVG